MSEDKKDRPKYEISFYHRECSMDKETVDEIKVSAPLTAEVKDLFDWTRKRGGH